MNDVQTSVGEEFEVALEGVPTSGFSWEPALTEETRVTFLGDDVDAPVERLGGPALQRFRFSAREAGEVELRFVYRRPWESRPPVEERTIRVRIGA